MSLTSSIPLKISKFLVKISQFILDFSLFFTKNCNLSALFRWRLTAPPPPPPPLPGGGGGGGGSTLWPRNPLLSHYQSPSFGSPITSSFSCESCKSNSQGKPDLGKSSSNICKRHSPKNGCIAQMGEEKTYYSF